MNKFLRWFLPSCPNEDGGKLRHLYDEGIAGPSVYGCDICHEEFI